jgi:hypothetical protein
MAIPKEGYFKLEQGRYGPNFPRTPACYGFSVIGKVKPGTAGVIRDYGKSIEAAVAADPSILAPLRLHYLRWVLFDNDTRFIYQGIFDTDFDTYIDDAIAIFMGSGLDTIFVNLEGFPEDWKTNAVAVAQFFRERDRPDGGEAIAAGMRVEDLARVPLSFPTYAGILVRRIPRRPATPCGGKQAGAPGGGLSDSK